MRDNAERRGFLTAVGRGMIHATAAAVLVFGSAGTSHAQRQSGIQLSPDQATYIISKDVGDERWAITYNLDRKVVIGNVFPQNGGNPSFLFCTIDQVDQAPNPVDAMYHMTCQFAQSCGQAPCANQWGAPFPVPAIPGSFFLPTGTTSTFAGNVQPILSSTCATSLACHVAGGAGPVDLAAGAAYDNIFEKTATQDLNKVYVAAFDPTISYLMNKVDGTGLGGRMPLGGPFLAPETADVIRNWILEGAANN